MRKNAVRQLTGIMLVALIIAGASTSAATTRERGPRLGEGHLFVTSCPQDQQHDQERGYCLRSDEGLLGTGLARRSEPVHTEVLRFDTRGEEERQVTKNELFELSSAVWSPNGRRMAVGADPSNDYEQCRLYIVRPRSGSMKPITPYEDLTCPTPTDWSSDGEWILMSLYEYDGPQYLYKLRPDGSRFTQLTDFSEEAQGAYDAVWVDENRSIVFWGTPNAGREGIYIMRADGSHMRPLVEVQATPRNSKHIDGFAVSEDREWLAYIVHDGRRGARRDEVFLLKTDGTSRRRLTSNTIEEISLSWSPDNRHLAIVQGSRYETQPKTRIEILDAFSGSSTVIAAPSEGVIYRWRGPDWSPSGRRIAFLVESAGGRAIYTASRRSQPRQVTEFVPNLSLLGWRG